MMGCAFYAETQIWPEMADDPELVMFHINWDDKPQYVGHKPHVECPKDFPHLMEECGRFIALESSR